jgi:beta-N-acetylhexosaminidase
MSSASHRTFSLILFFFLLASVLMPVLHAQPSPTADTPRDTVQPLLQTRLTPEIFSQKWVWAEETLAKMTVEEKIGQLITAFSFSRYVSEDDVTYLKLAQLINEGKVGGVMFSKGDVYETAMISNRLQRYAKYPLLIAADMEWGVSMRIDRTTEFPLPMAVAATRNPDYSFKVGEITAKEGRALGIHHNYSPSVDLNTNPRNPIINARAFSDNLDLANTMASAFINGSQSAGMLATIKHFPGHGDTEDDSHKELPVLGFDKARLDSRELRPFKAAIDGGVMSVMVGHLALPQITNSEKLPASLSPKITTDILKTELGFKGLTVTDGMGMQGVKKNYSTAEATVQAFLAGNDIILLPPNYEDAFAALYYAVQNGQITKERLDESVRKILITKECLALPRNRFVDIEKIAATVSTTESERLAQEIADKSMTLIKNDAATLPFAPSDEKTVHISLQNSATCNVGRVFHSELQKRLDDKVVRFTMTGESNSMDYETTLRAAEKADRVILSSFADFRAWEGKYGMDKLHDKFLKKLLAKLSAKSIPVAMVSFGTPYLISQYPDVNAYLCAYSGGTASETAAAKTILGDLNPKGKLPVRVSAEYPLGKSVSYPDGKP